MIIWLNYFFGYIIFLVFCMFFSNVCVLFLCCYLIVNIFFGIDIKLFVFDCIVEISE